MPEELLCYPLAWVDVFIKIAQTASGNIPYYLTPVDGLLRVVVVEQSHIHHHHHHHRPSVRVEPNPVRCCNCSLSVSRQYSMVPTPSPLFVQPSEQGGFELGVRTKNRETLNRREFLIIPGPCPWIFQLIQPGWREGHYKNCPELGNLKIFFKYEVLKNFYNQNQAGLFS